MIEKILMHLVAFCIIVTAVLYFLIAFIIVRVMIEYL